MKLIIIITIIILLLILYNKNPCIDFFAISLKNTIRIKQINEQQYKYNFNVTVFDAINGNTLDQDDLYNKKILSINFKDNNSPKRYREIGCYMSHLQLLQNIKNNYNSKYSVIFEDDFIISNNNFFNIIYDSLHYLCYNNIDFDIIFLGNLVNNHAEVIHNNLYNFDYNSELIGMYSYLINNKNIDKILKLIEFIDNPIDVKINHLIKNYKLKVFMIFPTIATVNFNLESTIL